MKNYDWIDFTKRISVWAHRDDIIKVWVTRDGLERWFLKQAEFTTSDAEIRPAPH
ncbi:MAG: hypothetical protein WBD22_04180 [Pyrinomonadaceae bacterium]